jgi:bifunctional DNA-binding transcriptional regulator/antitoxin component of YhaV-PrlF toxin-antitoxin module
MISIIKDQPKKITSIFITGKVSATMVIPIETARKYGLEEGTHVTLQEMPEGILLRKLEL